MNRNFLNGECELHKKPYQFMCCYSKCSKHLICEKCRREHLQIHPSQFLYELANLRQIHSYNKVDKLKELLVKQRILQTEIIENIYKPFQTLVLPLTNRVKKFATESRFLIEQQRQDYEDISKKLIEEAQKQIRKSNTKDIQDDPNRMLQQTINEAQIVNTKESRMIQSGDAYKWYSDKTKNMCAAVVTEIKSMISVGIKIIDNSMNSQKSKYTSQIDAVDAPQEMSFYKRYHASNEVALERVKLETDILSSKSMLEEKDAKINKAKKEVRDKVIKINELEEKVEGLREQLTAYEKKLQRQALEKKAAEEKQNKKKQQVLIKNRVIGSAQRSLCFDRKIIPPELFDLILTIVPNPLSLDLSNHTLNEEQLQVILAGCQNIQIFKYNFTHNKPDAREKLIRKCLRSFPHLIQIELNSDQINNEFLYNLADQFPVKLKVLYLIDNNITDEGLEYLCLRMECLEQLYVSFNKALTGKCLQGMSKLAGSLKVLHIAKYKIELYRANLKHKGGHIIAKQFREIEELFIGSTGIAKDGLLQICKNCHNLKRLSLSANEVTTDVVTQIMLGLQKLKWLDLSYTELTEQDIQKIQKLKIFNKGIQIVYST